MTSARLPHSEIPGSKPVCGSPRLFAAYRVLLRLSAPRHPPCTLSSLTNLEFLLTRRILSLLTRFSCQRTFRNQTPIFQSALSIPWKLDRGLRAERIDLVRPSVHPKRFQDRTLLRKEVIQPQVLLQLPCYDFTPIAGHTMDGFPPCGLDHRLPVQPTFVM